MCNTIFARFCVCLANVFIVTILFFQFFSLFFACNEVRKYVFLKWPQAYHLVYSVGCGRHEKIARSFIFHFIAIIVIGIFNIGNIVFIQYKYKRLLVLTANILRFSFIDLSLSSMKVLSMCNVHIVHTHTAQCSWWRFDDYNQTRHSSMVFFLLKIRANWRRLSSMKIILEEDE